MNDVYMYRGGIDMLAGVDPPHAIAIAEDIRRYARREPMVLANGVRRVMWRAVTYARWEVGDNTFYSAWLARRRGATVILNIAVHAADWSLRDDHSDARWRYLELVREAVS